MIMKYEISKGTLAVIPNEFESSLVFEDEERYIIKEKPFNIMDDSCKYFGSTYEGRKNGAKEILGAEYKVPIVIEDSDNLIVFPTTSPSSDECAWIVLKRVKKIEKVDGNNTKIIFDNNIELIVPSSYRSIENQLSRASRLDLILRNHKKMQKIIIQKEDQETKERLKGVKFLITNETGKVIFQGETNEEGIIELSGLAYGTYKIIK